MPEELLPSTPSGGPRFVTLNADDYGLSDGIDRAILHLAGQGRIHAVSCMTEPARWPAAADLLRSLPADVSIGLHLTLTALPPGVPLATPSLIADPGPGGLLARSLAARLDLPAIATRITRQLDRFEDALGRAPTHLDGHQHVHAMPGVSAVLSNLLARRFASALPWLRVTAPALPAAPGSALRRFVIAGIGSHQRRALHGTSFRSNLAFGGIRGFAERLPYGALFERQLGHAAGDGTLIMCHPGTGTPLPGDPIAAAREAEFAFLAGDEFGGALGRSGCSLRSLVPRPIDATGPANHLY